MNKLKKGFLKTNFKTLEISNSRLITGIVIGLLFSFVFYSFLYVTREMFRILSEPYNYELWVLTDREVSFYNLFFAFISVIFGQSICFNYWIDRPKRLFKRERFRKVSIINDQRVLMWYFLSWFSKIGLAFGIMFSISLYGGFYVFSLYPDFNYVFILIIIVLFLQSWNSIRISFKGKSLKWMIILAIVISCVSYGFSKVDIVDYKNLNNRLLQNNIHYKYNLTLPESNNYQWSYRQSMLENIYVVKPKDQNKSKESIIVIDNKEVPLDSVFNKLHDLKLKRDKVDRRFIIYQLNIDKGIETGIVNDLKFQISKLGSTRIAYSVVPNNPEFDQRFYRNYSIFAKLPGIDSSRFNIYEAISYFNQFKNEIEIVQLDNGDCIINNTIIELDSLYDVVQDIMINNKNHYFKFYPNESVEFSKYISVLSQSQQAVNDLRDYYSISRFSKEFDELFNRAERDEVTKKYPFRLIEYSDDLIKFLENNEKSTGANSKSYPIAG